MMTMAETLGCGQEVYSIDECFLDMTGIPVATERARRKQAEIQRGIGIATCIGMGSSKTLAKLANHIARQLQAGGVHTVLDLKRLDPATVKRSWSVVLERTVRELNGIACLELDDQPAPKQEIACTRSFGEKVTELVELRQAVTEFASRAAQKLRGQGSLAGAVLVFVRTSPFRPNDAQYARSITLPLRLPSSDTLRITDAALRGLQAIFRPGFNYAKAGVMLLDLQAKTADQQELDLGDDARVTEVRNGRLMAALDALNDRYGKGTLKLGSALVEGRDAGQRSRWVMKQERRTPRYTTRVGELV
ncbi:DUF4113 domain-containing protein, partial [Aquabacterium sp. A08]|uniref:DinB/UmuC family translesion DNA polymerase n=1 Tax=Aquabacterium sp. A08 TaxID=2718532 RepID=UPI00210F5D8D